jgi:hypothetical protein
MSDDVEPHPTKLLLPFLFPAASLKRGAMNSR